MAEITRPTRTVQNVELPLESVAHPDGVAGAIPWRVANDGLNDLRLVAVDLRGSPTHADLGEIENFIRSDEIYQATRGALPRTLRSEFTQDVTRVLRGFERMRNRYQSALSEESADTPREYYYRILTLNLFASYVDRTSRGDTVREILQTLNSVDTPKECVAPSPEQELRHFEAAVLKDVTIYLEGAVTSFLGQAALVARMNELKTRDEERNPWPYLETSVSGEVSFAHDLREIALLTEDLRSFRAGRAFQTCRGACELLARLDAATTRLGFQDARTRSLAVSEDIITDQDLACLVGSFSVLNQAVDIVAEFLENKPDLVPIRDSLEDCVAQLVESHVEEPEIGELLRTGLCANAGRLPLLREMARLRINNVILNNPGQYTAAMTDFFRQVAEGGPGSPLAPFQGTTRFTRELNDRAAFRMELLRQGRATVDDEIVQAIGPHLTTQSVNCTSFLRAVAEIAPITSKHIGWDSIGHIAGKLASLALRGVNPTLLTSCFRTPPYPSNVREIARFSDNLLSLGELKVQGLNLLMAHVQEVLEEPPEKRSNVMGFLFEAEAALALTHLGYTVEFLSHRGERSGREYDLIARVDGARYAVEVKNVDIALMSWLRQHRDGFDGIESSKLWYFCACAEYDGFLPLLTIGRFSNMTNSLRDLTAEWSSAKRYLKGSLPVLDLDTGAFVATLK